MRRVRYFVTSGPWLTLPPVGVVEYCDGRLGVSEVCMSVRQHISGTALADLGFF